jgi:hypothetical protein
MSPCREKAEGASGAQAAAEEPQDRQKGLQTRPVAVCGGLCIVHASHSIVGAIQRTCDGSRLQRPAHPMTAVPDLLIQHSHPVLELEREGSCNAGVAPCHGSLNDLPFNPNAGRRFHRRGPCDDASSSQARSPQTSSGQARGVRRVRRGRHPSGGTSCGQGMMSCRTQQRRSSDITPLPQCATDRWLP